MKRQALFHKKKKNFKITPYGIPESNLFVTFSRKYLVVT